MIAMFICPLAICSLIGFFMIFGGAVGGATYGWRRYRRDRFGGGGGWKPDPFKPSGGGFKPFGGGGHKPSGGGHKPSGGGFKPFGGGGHKPSSGGVRHSNKGGGSSKKW